MKQINKKGFHKLLKQDVYVTHENNDEYYFEIDFKKSDGKNLTGTAKKKDIKLGFGIPSFIKNLIS